MNPDLIFIDGLIQAQESAKRTYAAMSIVLYLTAAAILIAAFKASDKIILAAPGAIIGIVGAVPTKLVNAVKTHKLNYEYLKNTWQSANASHDQAAIEAVHAELVSLRQNALRKNWWEGI